MSEQTTLEFLKANCPTIYKKLPQEVLEKLSKKSEAKKKATMEGVKKFRAKLELDRLKAEVEAQQAPCRNCDGTKCGQPIRGVRPVLSMDVVPHISMQICPYEPARRRQETITRMLHGSGLPPNLENLTWDDYKADSKEASYAMKLGKAVGSGEVESGLYIYGTRGTGKTMLATLIAKDCIKRCVPTLFVFTPELLQQFRNAIEDDGGGEDPAKVAREADCLILDDIGAERATPWVAEQLMALINHRYAHKKLTIFTSNFEPETLASHISGGKESITGYRIVSRILAMTVVVPLNGKDRRLCR